MTENLKQLIRYALTTVCNKTTANSAELLSRGMDYEKAKKLAAENPMAALMMAMAESKFKQALDDVHKAYELISNCLEEIREAGLIDEKGYNVVKVNVEFYNSTYKHFRFDAEGNLNIPEELRKLATEGKDEPVAEEKPCDEVSNGEKSPEDK